LGFIDTRILANITNYSGNHKDVADELNEDC